MRILHIGSECGHGGIETMLATLSAEQVTSGHEVDLYYIKDLGGANQYENICPVIFLKDKNLGRLLLERNYDVIHVVTWVTRIVDISKSLSRAMYTGPVVVTAHGYRGWEARLRYDSVTAVSKYVARSIQERSTSEVECIYNGIDINRYYSANNKSGETPILAWVGRTHDPDKDFMGLLAFARTSAAQGFRIVVINGSSSDQDRDMPWLPAGSEVIHRMRAKDMPDFYRRVAASGGFLLSTSRREGFGLNLIEAGACGCPVIAPAVGAMPELIIDKQTGVLFERTDGVKGIGAAVEWLYSDNNYCSVADAAVDHVRANFSSTKMAEEYKQLYDRVIEEHPAPAKSKVVARAILSKTYRSLRKLRAV